MTLRSYLIILFLGTILSFFSFALILFYIDPFETTLIGHTLFFISLLFGLIGLFSLIGFYVRVLVTRNEIIFSHVGPAFRQGILLSLIVISCLILQSLRMLSWWNALLICGIIGLLEFYFLSR